jgi:hypothetical protein
MSHLPQQDLEHFCRKEFGIADDAKLVATTADLPASDGRSVEIHNSPETWEALMSAPVGKIAVELVGKSLSPRLSRGVKSYVELHTLLQTTKLRCRSIVFCPIPRQLLSISIYARHNPYSKS